MPYWKTDPPEIKQYILDDEFNVKVNKLADKNERQQELALIVRRKRPLGLGKNGIKYGYR